MNLEIKVSELAEALDSEVVGVVNGNPMVSITMDSRDLQDKTVFWAFNGENFDSHNFVGEVMEKGIPVSVVNSKWVEQNPDSVQAYIPVADSGKALLKLAKKYANRFDMKKIAITGSNGKTTTKDMIHALLGTHLNGMATQGNFNNHIGVPKTIFRMKHEMDYAVVEMGTNHPGEISPLSKCLCPDISIITNIGESHLEFFHKRENVFKEKLSIRDGLKRNGWLVVNADDEFLSRCRATKSYRIKTFGIERGQVSPDEIQWNEYHCAKFRIGRTWYELNVPGKHNLLNALAAIAVGEVLKLNRGQLAEGIANYRGTDLRMQIHKLPDCVIASDCYNANPSSMKMALNTLAEMNCTGERIAVLGDMLELGDLFEQMHFELGENAAKVADKIFCIGAGAAKLKAGALAAGMSADSISVCADLESLESELESLIGFGNLLLVKGSRGMKLDLLVNGLIEERVDR